MKGPLNPELKVDDVIMLLHMEKETGVPPGTIGVVTSITKDPFEFGDSKLISVKWENGSNLNLVTAKDMWLKTQNDNIQEQHTDNQSWDYITKNADVFENFDWKWLEKFLYKLRDTGIVNMYGSSQLLYAGSEHIERYYGEGKEDDEEFQEFLELADEAKNKIIQGVIKYMNANGKDLDDMSVVNRYARLFSEKILGLYIALSSLGNRN
jgi:hypothetical protein